ncbi:DUF3592 domain-containing protein [Ideonella livida]|uniref:DUF3592 domain-containing protein n=1 Tax=Ideonella livida TaxID=2707176 RepID=A0A7C9PJB9_9BURK|nr:DUF3592 domain-containing protein [Ideonella livida]NDY92490.1 DUF3592 domain-containing protein [Ideonella livida]
MLDYLRDMLDLALRKEVQGIHFWATVYVLVVLGGSLWHVLKVRAWPHAEGQLLSLGIRPLGGAGLGSGDADHVPSALYRYQVNGQEFLGHEISVWKMSASGLLKNAAYVLPRLVAVEPTGRVRIYYHPKHPNKSLLLRPGWMSLCSLTVAMGLTAALYLWSWHLP